MSDPQAIPTDRRAFLTSLGAAALVGPFAAARVQDPASKPASQPAGGAESRGEPPIPPGIDVAAIAAAEKLASLEFTPKEREMMVRVVADNFRTIGLVRAAKLRNAEGPAEVFAPIAPAPRPHEEVERMGPAAAPAEAPPIPKEDEDIAFAPVTQLSKWIATRQITSERLTKIYLERLKRYDPKLLCVVTLMEEKALAQARRADAEIRDGKIRGPLHGIPWGAKDLFDTKGTVTTWGGEPWKERVPNEDAAVVERLDEAGAVLVAKLSLGALAYGDIWFGGTTKNPFKPAQGSSGSSAGSAAAAAAGLVGFALGTETWGSIASPCGRCGASGFRPSFGLVSRAGAMALCWSLDKVGPIARTVEDCALVLEAIAGDDASDPATVDRPSAARLGLPPEKLKLGYSPAEFEGRRANADDKNVLEALRKVGVELVPIEVAPGAYSSIINLLICVEAASAFDEMTRSDQDDQLRWQAPNAWPNLFRAIRLYPAVDYVQARRMRRRFMEAAHALFANVDAIVAPSSHGDLHAITNMTGHPAVTLRQGFRDDGTPRPVTLWGRLYDDGTLLRLGAALETKLGIWSRRPPA